ncbi:hypothetical protein ACCO45_003893 [Purpureocillium lilacinum]|uniref:Uncharacterized protein n=1 Tax=Purpureocillium lilacinum TaxID=33203 RepID=A0ACC4E163_PURLI
MAQDERGRLGKVLGDASGHCRRARRRQRGEQKRNKLLLRGLLADGPVGAVLASVDEQGVAARVYGAELSRGCLARVLRRLAHLLHQPTELACHVVLALRRHASPQVLETRAAGYSVDAAIGGDQTRVEGAHRRQVQDGQVGVRSDYLVDDEACAADLQKVRPRHGCHVLDRRALQDQAKWTVGQEIGQVKGVRVGWGRCAELSVTLTGPNRPRRHQSTKVQERGPNNQQTRTRRDDVVLLVNGTARPLEGTTETGDLFWLDREPAALAAGLPRLMPLAPLRWGPGLGSLSASVSRDLSSPPAAMSRSMDARSGFMPVVSVVGAFMTLQRFARQRG